MADNGVIRNLRVQDLQWNKKPGNKILPGQMWSFILYYIRLAHVFVEWDGEEGHSVVEGKVVQLKESGASFIAGAKVICTLKQGLFGATIIATG